MYRFCRFFEFFVEFVDFWAKMITIHAVKLPIDFVLGNFAPSIKTNIEIFPKFSGNFRWFDIQAKFTLFYLQ